MFLALLFPGVPPPPPLIYLHTAHQKLAVNACAAIAVSLHFSANMVEHEWEFVSLSVCSSAWSHWIQRTPSVPPSSERPCGVPVQGHQSWQRRCTYTPFPLANALCLPKTPHEMK